MLGLYLAMSTQEFALVHRALVEAGHHRSSTIIWAKDSLVIGRKDYHPQYEPIWYGWREGAPRAVPVVDCKQSDLGRYSPKVSEEHPTMKPVELVLRALMNSSKSGALVFEPFSGSGIAIIASEQAGRRCRAIELDPSTSRRSTLGKDDRQESEDAQNEKKKKKPAPIGRPTKLSPEIQEASVPSWLRAPTSKPQPRQSE